VSKADRKARFREKVKETAEANGHPGEGDELSPLTTTRLDGVKPRSVRYLVAGYIPRGKLVLLAGDGGHGKSLITLHLIACLTTGRPCFGLEYQAPPPAEALIVCCEDDYADTVVPRLIAAGADLSKVYSVDGVKSKDGKPTPFSLAHYEALEKELEQRPNVRLIVIDPAGAYIGRAGIDDHKDSELRALLGPLAELAARRNVTIIIVKHFNKGASIKAVHKVTGSAGYVNCVRAGFVVAPDTEEEGKRFFLPIKFNIGPKPVGLAYQLEGLPADEQEQALEGFQLDEEDRPRLAEQLVRVRWLGLADVDADEILAASARHARDATRVETCGVWLREFLKEYAYPSTEIEQAAKKQGFTFDNLKEAKARLRREADFWSTNKGHFQGEWWCGFGKPEGWVLRPEPPTPPETPETPHYGQNSGKTEASAKQSAPHNDHSGERSPPHNGHSGEREETVKRPFSRSGAHSGESRECGESGGSEERCPPDQEAAAEREAIEAQAERVDSARDEPWSPE
jgi:hypothetical protein